MAEIEKISSEFGGVPLVLTAGIEYTDPDSIRFEESLRFTEAARDEGVPTVLIDSSPEDAQGTWVADAHRSRGAIVLTAETPGEATVRQQGVRHVIANGAEKVVGTDPELVNLPRSAGELALALDTADILAIGRTDAAEQSLPDLQRRTERLAGWILGETLKLPRESIVGPRGFTVAGAEILVDYPAQTPGLNNWLYKYMTMLAGRAHNLRIDGIQTDIEVPERITAEEDGNPSFDEMRLNLFGMQLGILLTEACKKPMPVREADIAGVTQAHLPLLAGMHPVEFRMNGFTLLEKRLADIFGYQPPEQPAAA